MRKRDATKNHSIMNTEANTNEGKVGTKREGVFREILAFVFLAVIIVVPIRLFVASPFVVSGASMSPTFETGHYLVVDEISYRFTNPKRGDVIVFRYPKQKCPLSITGRALNALTNDDTYAYCKFFIKRIIGLPGETVSIANGTVRIINDEHPEGMQIDEPYIEFEKYDNLVSTLSDTEYFVMGDNRRASSDSRTWGTLEKRFITGRALIRLFPVTLAGIFPGAYAYK